MVTSINVFYILVYHGIETKQMVVFKHNLHASHNGN